MDIIAIIMVVLIGLDVFICFATESIIKYKRHKKIERMLNYLQTYYWFYYSAINYKTDFEAAFADDIYFVMDKHLSYNDAKELAKLLIAIGYRKRNDKVIKVNNNSFFQ